MVHSSPTLDESLKDVPTPALVIDATVVQHNIDKLAKYASEKGLALRPHTKTHKSKFLAGLQKQAGITGLTAAKAGEAELMAEVSNDILVAYPALDPHRTSRLAQLAHKVTVRVAVDSLLAAQSLAHAAKQSGSEIGLLVDLDVGMHRTGYPTPQHTLELARQIAAMPGLRLDGLFCYPGHIWNKPSDQDGPLGEVSALLDEALTLWKRDGLEAKIVSGGSTPTAYQSHLVSAYTEIRPGTYIFNDMNTVSGGFCSIEECAATLVCTVISTTVADQVVLDGGSKTFTMDRCIPAPESGHGLLLGYPGAKIKALSEEHAQVDISQCERKPQLGERVRVIPNHICPCVNLQDAAWWLSKDGQLTQLPIDARGKLS